MIEILKGNIFKKGLRKKYSFDLYDLLDEEGLVMSWTRMTYYQKYYTIGPMNYRAEEQQSNRSEEKLPFTLHE